MTIQPRRKLCSPNGKPVVLRAIHPNVGITVGYRKRLDRAIVEMQNSIIYWLRATYRANPPTHANDASSAADLIAQLRSLGRRWILKFSRGSKALGEYFATAVQNRSDSTLKQILKDSGFSVKFQMSRAMNDVVQATIGAQVSLIKSIPSEYMTAVEGVVLRSVQQGSDLKTLTDQLMQLGAKDRNRAGLIARDQNAKATAAMTRVRYQEMGMTKAIWMHSGGGHEPRPTHVAFAKGKLGGPVYDIAEGWLDPAVNERIWPGTLINCRCVAGAVLPSR